jgi:hypothetical protein
MSEEEGSEGRDGDGIEVEVGLRIFDNWPRLRQGSPAVFQNGSHLSTFGLMLLRPSECPT